MCLNAHQREALEDAIIILSEMEPLVKVDHYTETLQVLKDLWHQEIGSAWIEPDKIEGTFIPWIVMRFARCPRHVRDRMREECNKCPFVVTTTPSGVYCR